MAWMMGILLLTAFFMMMLLGLVLVVLCLIVRSQYQEFCEWKKRGCPWDLDMYGNLFILFSGRR
jgi:hypothetical protein